MDTKTNLIVIPGPLCIMDLKQVLSLIDSTISMSSLLGYTHRLGKLLITMCNMFSYNVSEMSRPSKILKNTECTEVLHALHEKYIYECLVKN